MTRREWLAKNPPPPANGELLARAEQLERAGDAVAALRMRQAAPAAARCLLHPQAKLYRHRNRMEDLFACEQGPHYLLWTAVNGRPQLIPVYLALGLPDMDGLIG